MDKKLLKIIACPECKNSLELIGNILYCKKCDKKYEIKEDIPILL